MLKHSKSQTILIFWNCGELVESIIVLIEPLKQLCFTFNFVVGLHTVACIALEMNCIRVISTIV